MEHWDSSDIINVGWGIDVTIKELAEMIANKVNYKGKILWDTSKPDGMLRKRLDVTKLSNLGFQPFISLKE
jgi:GDP-L-fucose synthase